MLHFSESCITPSVGQSPKSPNYVTPSNEQSTTSSNDETKTTVPRKHVKVTAITFDMTFPLLLLLPVNQANLSWFY